MLGGIIFQMVTISIYAFCATEFLIRYLYNRPLGVVSSMGYAQPGDKSQSRTHRRGEMDKKLKAMLCALIFSTVCLFIR
jgi:hypothetical protein